MRGMLLAAGLGTRLRPLTDERPKPVVPVGHRPLATWATDALVGAGVRRIDANAFHLHEQVASRLSPFVPPSVDFRVHVEAELLGTGGGIRAAVGDVDEPVLVMNGDIQFSPDVTGLLETHASTGAEATLVVRPHPNPFAMGAVEVDESGLVVAIAGAPAKTRPATRAYVFTGVHLLEPRVVAALPERGCVVRQAYQPLLARGGKLAVHVDRSAWADLGTLSAYLEANLDLADESADERGLVHRTADLAVGARLRRCVVGQDASIAADADLEDCVVWDGALARGSHRRVIFSRGAVVPVPVGA